MLPGTQWKQTSISFSFGQNWQQFKKHINQERIDIAMQSLQEVLQCTTLEGKRFLDIGCGSGIFCIAALALGAKEVIGFDYNPDAIRACKEIQPFYDHENKIQFLQGSALDAEFLQSLGTFDVVYSWGVLHHTGNMWSAIVLSMKNVAPQGLYCIALYNDVGGLIHSRRWLWIKQTYNKQGWFGKKCMVGMYYVFFHVVQLCKGNNPWRIRREYTERGMEWWTDVYDWLGGYPYEFVRMDKLINEVVTFDLTFQLIWCKENRGLGNHAFVFKKVR